MKRTNVGVVKHTVYEQEKMVTGSKTDLGVIIRDVLHFLLCSSFPCLTPESSFAPQNSHTKTVKYTSHLFQLPPFNRDSNTSHDSST